MTKKEIFDEVVRIMCQDSATKKDLEGADPKRYRQQISEEMSSDDFVFLVQSYLGSFGVLSHLGFYLKSDKKRAGFSLRYYGGKLYVTEAEAETGLVKGDCLTHLGGQTIKTCQALYADFLTSKNPEYQFMQWRRLALRLGQVNLLRQGKEKSLHLKWLDSERDSSNDFAWEQITPDTVYVKLENFWDEGKLQALYAESKDAISSSCNLIIDVRVNHGGSDVHYYPLLVHGLPAGKGFADVVDQGEDFGMEILYTERNVDLRLAIMEEQLQSPHLTEDIRAFVERFISDLKTNRGKGFVRYDGDDDDWPDKNLRGSVFPKQVVVLSDVMCGSSGDNFVATMKNLPKVTVMGRGTMGVLDYSNCCSLELDDYKLLFPTSRWLAIDDNKGMTDKGIEPDIVIPWTPEHLAHDVDLEKALSFLGEKS